MSQLIKKPIIKDESIIFKTPQTPPIHPRKRKRQKILDEDSYVEQIGKIIERDYFPDLNKLKDQNDYLDAVERNDLVKIREFYLKYNPNGLDELSTNRTTSLNRISSPATFETPANIHNTQNATPTTRTTTTPPPLTTTKIAENETEKKKEINLSLDEFLNTHTSQDNESFNDILIENDRKLREKYSYLYNEENKSEEEKLKELELPSIEEQCQTNNNNKSNNIINRWNYKNRNYIMYVPNGVELSEKDLMELNKNRKEINTKNTRLELNPFNEIQSKELINELAKNQSKVLDGKIGVDGKELLIKNSNQNFSFVQTPSPSPNYLNSTPLMTWGEIDGTPFNLDGNSTPKLYCQSFKISNVSKREQLALELAEKVGEKNRNQKQKAIDVARRQFITTPSPRPNSTSDRLLTMSPAARKLAQTKLGLNFSDNILSPLPPNRIRTPQTPTKHRLGHNQLTPKLNLGIKKVITDNHLTDNLLDLPKRQKAADFF